MKRKSRNWMVAIFSLIAMGAVIYAVSKQIPRTPAESAVAKIDSDASTETSNKDLSQGGASKSVKQRNVPLPKRSLAERFADTNDLKAFIAEISFDASSGNGEAQFFTARALEECMTYAANPTTFIESHQEPPLPTADKALYANAVQRIASRCGSFISGDIKLDEVGMAYEAASSAGYLPAVARELFQNVDSMAPNDLKKRVTDIISSGDPYAINELAGVMGVRSEGQGDIFGDLSGTELDWYAWKIAACELGYPCGSRSPDVVGYCVNQGICGFGDIREIFRNAILSSVDYQRAEALSQSVLQLINESAT